MLKILDASCRRFGFDHVVLTDHATKPLIPVGMGVFAFDLPQSLMKATTEAHARWLEDWRLDVDTIFVGADCIIRRDFRHQMPAGDIAIAYMLRHKKWRMQNGFMYVPRASRTKVAPVLRAVANDTSEVVCDDMLALERALLPMPPEYGVQRRQGIDVNFLPLPVWNCCVKRADNPAQQANVMHFMGGWRVKGGQVITEPEGKGLFFAWAKRHGFA
jgi:hypothetical protein